MLGTILFVLCTLWLNGCGVNVAKANLLYTAAGTYQYQVTATSTTGIEQTQNVTLTLIVTAH